MKLIELHILQSFPVSCLNRDDVGAPKMAVFGGVNRARVSSQCLKRAIRDEMRRQAATSGLVGDRFKGKRTKRLIKDLADAMDSKQAEPIRLALAEFIAEQLSTLSSVRDENGQLLVSTLTYLTPSEIKAIGQAVNGKPELFALAETLTQAGDVLRKAEEAEEKRVKEAGKGEKQKLEDAEKRNKRRLKNPWTGQERNAPQRCLERTPSAPPSSRFT